MKLTSELAQYIINYTSRFIHVVINIMDTDAMIIASTDSVRIGEKHLGARKVLMTGQPYTMRPEEALRYPNVVPGISLPIHFQNDIIGVVGVGIGEHDETIGRMLQSTTELLIEQVTLKESVNAEEQVRNEFLTHLLTDPWHNNEFYFNYQIKLHHFNPAQCYLIATVAFPDNTFETSETDGGDSEIVYYERSISRLMDTIKLRLNSLQARLVFIPNALTFLVPYNENSLLSKQHFLNKFIHSLDFVLSQTLQPDYRIGIGGYADNMTQIHTQYKHAASALKIAAFTNPDKKITDFRDICFEHLLLNIPTSKQSHYIQHIIGPLLHSDPDKNTWIQTLEAYFDNNQSLKKTADALFIHRNTLLFRLNRIAEITGFNPQNLKDAITLYTALTLWKMQEPS